MLDHAFLDAIAAFRRTFEEAMLERHAVEERLQVDVLLGDLSWETSYSVPGEGPFPTVRADLSLDWPTWSQTALRTWRIGEEPDDPPELLVQVAIHVSRLRSLPDVAKLLASFPLTCTAVEGCDLERQAPTVEHQLGADFGVEEYRVELVYEGQYVFSEQAVEDPAVLAGHVNGLGGWVASRLVRLSDLPLDYRPLDGGEVR